MTKPSSKSSLLTQPVATAGLFALGLVAALLFLLPATAGLSWLRLIAKPVPVLCMALWLAGQPAKGLYQVAVIVGLILGAVGDVLLQLGDDLFVFGLGAFLVGHLAYVVAFLRDSRRTTPFAAVLSYGYGALFFVILFQAGNLGPLTFPVALYIAVICTMLWRGLARLRVPEIDPGSARNGAAGAGLFAISDSLLAVRMFVTGFPLASVLVIVTYWLGQLGIALSARTQQGPGGR